MPENRYRSPAVSRTAGVAPEVVQSWGAHKMGCITFPLPPTTSRLGSSDLAARGGLCDVRFKFLRVARRTNIGGSLCQSAHTNRANAAAPRRTGSVRA